MTPQPAAPTSRTSALTRLLQRFVPVREAEVGAMLLACGYFFSLLSSYYVLRPIRDEMGIAGGVRNLPWLFSATLVATLIANPIYSTLVARFPPRRFITITYRFFIANLLLFFLVSKFVPPESNVHVGRAFFVWTTVFSLFVVSVFWSLMADAFSSEQGKRLFGFIGAGGTLGGILGGALTASLVTRVGIYNMLLFSAVLLEIGVQCARRFPLFDPVRVEAGGAVNLNFARRQRDEAVGGGVLAGLANVVRSPYLLFICLFMLLFTIGSTFLYFQQTAIIEQTVADPKARTSLLAWIDVTVNSLTLVAQLFLTGRLLRLSGTGATLALLPLCSVIGFAVLGFAPLLAVVVIFQIVRRATNFAIAGPAREVLFTVLTREDKYKAKNLIDTFVYRGGDQLGAWANGLLMSVFHLSIGGVAFVAVPLSALWLLVALWLGRRQKELARDTVP